MNKEILYRFFEGTASYDDEVKVKEWMESSPDNAKEFYHERKLFDAMLLLGNAENKKNKRTILHHTIQVYLKEFVKIAAIAAFAFGVSWHYQQSKLDKIAQTMNVVTVPAGQRVNLTLSDGTNVWLNSRSTMQYPAYFSANKREVKLDGEAYFEVTHNAKRPFIVNTQKYNVKVLGTKFNVDAYSDMGEFSTALLEGSVKIVDRKNSANETLLLPDNKAFLHNGKLEMQPISDYNHYRWKEGLICFRDIKFSQLMSEFEKCYGFRIIIQNKSIENFEFSGKFRQSDGIDYALRVLQKDSYFTFSRDDERTIIYIR